MTVERLSRLFEALGNPTPINPSIEKKTAESSAVVSSQAVSLSADFGTQQSGSSEDRAAKVAQIKADVQAGTYNPDSRDVARALVRDLFVA